MDKIELSTLIYQSILAVGLIAIMIKFAIITRKNSKDIEKMHKV